MLCEWEANRISKRVLDLSIPAPEVCTGIALVRLLQCSAEPLQSQEQQDLNL